MRFLPPASTRTMQTYEVDEDFYEDGVDFGMQAGDQLYTDAENGEQFTSFSALALSTAPSHAHARPNLPSERGGRTPNRARASGRERATVISSTSCPFR